MKTSFPFTEEPTRRTSICNWVASNRVSPKAMKTEFFFTKFNFHIATTNGQFPSKGFLVSDLRTEAAIYFTSQEAK